MERTEVTSIHYAEAWEWLHDNLGLVIYFKRRYDLDERITNDEAVSELLEAVAKAFAWYDEDKGPFKPYVVVTIRNTMMALWNHRYSMFSPHRMWEQDFFPKERWEMEKWKAHPEYNQDFYKEDEEIVRTLLFNSGLTLRQFMAVCLAQEMSHVDIGYILGVTKQRSAQLMLRGLEMMRSKARRDGVDWKGFLPPRDGEYRKELVYSAEYQTKPV